jgi:hypothetical protein
MLQVRGVRGKRVGASWEKMYHSRIVELRLQTCLPMITKTAVAGRDAK